LGRARGQVNVTALILAKASIASMVPTLTPATKATIAGEIVRRKTGLDVIVSERRVSHRRIDYSGGSCATTALRATGGSSKFTSSTRVHILRRKRRTRWLKDAEEPPKHSIFFLVPRKPTLKKLGPITMINFSRFQRLSSAPDRNESYCATADNRNANDKAKLTW